MKTVTPSDQAGFTIVELIVTIVLFTILMPVLAMSIQSLETMKRQAKINDQINNLVQAKVENLRAQSSAQVTDGTTDFTADLPTDIPTPRSATYTISDNTTTPQLKYLDVIVQYGSSGAQKTYSYRTYIGP